MIAKRAEICGKEVEMTVPFEGVNSGEVNYYQISCGLEMFYVVVFFLCFLGYIKE